MSENKLAIEAVRNAIRLRSDKISALQADVVFLTNNKQWSSAAHHARELAAMLEQQGLDYATIDALRKG